MLQSDKVKKLCCYQPGNHRWDYLDTCTVDRGYLFGGADTFFPWDVQPFRDTLCRQKLWTKGSLNYASISELILAGN